MTFAIINDDIGPPNVGGRPSDPRLGKLDELAAVDVLASKFPDARTAARAYLPQYAPHIDANTPNEQVNIALRDVARRIDSKLKSLQSAK